MTAPVPGPYWSVAVAITLVVSAPNGFAQIPRPAPVQSPAGTAAITGVVVDALTERPLPGVSVTLTERPPGQSVRALGQVTSAQGRFAFVDLAASDWYFLTTSRPGYLDSGYERPEPRGPSAPIAIANGQWLRDLRIGMARPGSISGIVTDERGEPVVGAYVRVLPTVMVSGRPQWLAGPIARTDDRGRYRVAPLGPGRYLVSVPSVQATLPASSTLRAPGARAGTSRADLDESREADRAEKLLIDVDGVQQMVVGRHAIPPPPDSDGQPRAYPIVFYPGTATPADATAVELGASENRAGIDVQLRPVRTGRLSGMVQGPPEVVANRLLRLMPLGLEELGQGSETATTVTQADGRFTFFGVPMGSYVLESRQAMLELTHGAMDSLRTAVPAPVPFPARMAAAGNITGATAGVEFSMLIDGDEPSYWGRFRVDVSAPSTDVALPLHRSVTVSGRFVTATGEKWNRSAPRVALEPADGRRTLGLFRTLPFAKDDPSAFSIGGLLGGEYYLRVPGTAVASIIWNGQDHTDRPFDTTSGRDITNVVVTLGERSSMVSGVVTAASGTAFSGAAVIVFPIDQEGWSNYGFTPTRLKSALTTADGRYRIDGLPAGDYFVVAVPAAQERGWLDPAFLAVNVGNASRLRVESGRAVTDFSLRLAR